jgi:hypothetical protein
MDTPEFLLNVKIRRSDLVEWLQAVPPEGLTFAVENTLAAGHVVMELLQASTGEESMSRFFRPVVARMDVLQNSIDAMLKTTQKSVQQGALGENIACQQLRRAFPLDEFDIVSDQGHQADIHALFKFVEGQPQKALIEVKLYTGDVPGSEVEKFRRDLSETGVRYGLMISMTSGIAGIAGHPLHWDVFGNHLAIFAPRVGMDGYGLVCGAMLLKSIIAHENRTGALALPPAHAIEQAWKRLNLELTGLAGVVSELKELRESARTGQQELGRIFDSLVGKAVAAEVHLKQTVDRLVCSLAEEFADLSLKDRSLGLPIAKPNEVLAFLSALESKNDKRHPVFLGVYALATQSGFGISLDGDDWHCRAVDGKLVVSTKSTKHRVDAFVPCDSTMPLPLVASELEHVKSKNCGVLVLGHDPKMMLQLVAKLLGIH